MFFDRKFEDVSAFLLKITRLKIYARKKNTEFNVNFQPSFTTYGWYDVYECIYVSSYVNRVCN